MNTRIHRTLLSLCAATALTAAGASAAAQRTSIPFADIGNIRDWQAMSAEELYVQAMNRNWYRASFWAPCHSLPFAVGIAFVTEPNGQLDSFSSILVDGERCWFKTFERSEAPPPQRG
jgi:hypothetical protein